MGVCGGCSLCTTSSFRRAVERASPRGLRELSLHDLVVATANSDEVAEVVRAAAGQRRDVVDAQRPVARAVVPVDAASVSCACSRSCLLPGDRAALSDFASAPAPLALVLAGALPAPTLHALGGRAQRAALRAEAQDRTHAGSRPHSRLCASRRRSFSRRCHSRSSSLPPHIAALPVVRAAGVAPRAAAACSTVCATAR
jgi:hypothetical protein